METNLKDLFAKHLKYRLEILDEALENHDFESLVISSGQEYTYFSDDRSAPFVSTPHFVHYCPCPGAGHLLHLQRGKRPKLYFYNPEDFWHENTSLSDSFWLEHFDVTEFSSLDKRWSFFTAQKSTAFIGEEGSQDVPYTLKANPKSLLHELNWHRAQKSEYEVYCIKRANEIAAKGHKKAVECFSTGSTEFDIHIEYLKAIGHTEEQLPYTNIIGIDEKSAILHYQNKRKTSGRLLLIDAGAKFQFYASDITRTYLKKEAPGEFQALVRGVEKMQGELCQAVRAGVSFVDLHDLTHKKVATLLLDLKVIKSLDIDGAIEKEVTRKFFPHGLGHMLGLQVHDVAGQQMNKEGDPSPPATKYPKLRTCRSIREQEVITIEPGVYFIPVLLDKERSGANSQYYNWPLIDTLSPFGGARIEDDILVLKTSHENLTRPYLSLNPIL